ncbi:ABC transporter-like protein [Xylaria palmicola]|nr:ABC transporter-like protein [Xylaria palmicola]
MPNATICDDAAFGPTVTGCRGNFDFTLLFEQAFLSIAPSALFLLFAAGRLAVLLARTRGKRQITGTGFQRIKLVTAVSYGAVQTALLVLWARPGVYGTRTSLAAAILSLADAFGLAALSWLEHAYSPRPSALINVFLLFSALFDTTQARTLWLKESAPAIPILFTVALSVKIGLLALEAVEKDSFLPQSWRRRSPEEKSGVYNQSILFWLRRILVEGRKRILYPRDLYALDDSLDTSQLHQAFWDFWSSRRKKDSRHATALVLVKTLRWPLLKPVVPRLVQAAFTLTQPLLLREFLRYLEGNGNFVHGAGYGFIGAYGLVYFGLALATCWYWRLTYKSLVQMRGCLVSALYKKTTEIDTAQYDMTAPVSLMSADVERIIQGCKDLHEIWANCLQVAIAIFLLYREVGIAVVAPVVVCIVSSIGSVAMSSFADKAQVGWMEATQERVATTARAISSMKGVKLLGLSEGIHKIISTLRHAELVTARYFRYIEVLTATISFAPLLLSPVFTFLIFALASSGMGADVTRTSIFTTLSLLNLMTQPLVWLFQAVPLFVASLGCLDRIGQYLNAQPKTEQRSMYRTGSPQKPSATGAGSPLDVMEEKDTTSANAVAIRNGEFGWVNARPILTNVNIEIPRSQLTMIVGPVASGKSTLAKALIGEIPYSSGQLLLNTPRSDIAFCDQDPFLMNGSLRSNVVGFSDFNHSWYNTVLQAVDLLKDLASLPGGDEMQIGSRGVSLSGGQRQRVAVARAVYAQTPMAVFDDVLSGLDAVTKEHVFENVFGPRGLLRTSGTTIILFTHDVDLLPKADQVIALGKNGQVVDSGTFEYLSQASGYIKSLEIQDKADDVGPDKAGETVGVPAELSFEDDTAEANDPEDITRRLGDTSLYKYFFGHIGLWRMLLFAGFQCGWAVFSTIGPVWLEFWASANEAGQNRDGYYIGVYAVFQSLALAFLALFAGHTLTTMAVKAGISLHEVTLGTVMRAPMSFFSTVDTGVTTNRFSQDILLIDSELPTALLETVSAGLVAIVQMVLIAVAAPYVAIAYPFLIGSLYVLQGFYLRTSRQLRHLDLEAKSPLYTHFLETLHGLATIRSFGWSDAHNELNHRLVNSSQQPVYLLYMVQRWLQLALELMIAATAVILIAVAVQLQSTSAGLIGVALVNLMSISQELKMIVINWATLETSLGAIARTKTFAEKTSNENQAGETEIPADSWPHTGRVQLNGISASYVTSEQAKVAFEDVSLIVEGGQKVAICGRSGSGKSSIIMALARMLDLTSGSITIDGLDLSTMPRSEVRSRLNIVPQEPYFYYKTLSENLDPSGNASPESMRAALEKVQLLEVVKSNGSLDSDLNVETLSQGQKQLLALARAMLRPSKILVLDEATSSVDKHTAKIMQHILRTEFQSQTIIAVAHQLNTIIDFDHVVVMNAGKLVEGGRPSDLLAVDSMFKRLCDIQGVTTPN